MAFLNNSRYVASTILWLYRISVNSKTIRLLGQHLLIPCFLSPAETLASDDGRLLLLILIILLF